MTAKIIVGDCMDALPTLPERFFQTCITSPPYWGLRDYGTAEWEGGDPGCDHSPGGESRVGESTLQGGKATSGHKQEPYREVCGKCGAVRADKQLGLERLHDCLGWATGEPCGECYVCHTVAWAREVRRVLRDDGTLWVVIGDSYASGKGTCYNPGGGKDSLGQNRKAAGAHPLDRGNKSELAAGGLKPKDLVGIPWRVALALQADGWWLRSDVIWAKPNPMPESVRDRPTKAHEYIFLFAKSAKYYWDQEAVREGASGRACGNRTYKYDGVPGMETKQGILAVADKPYFKRNIRTVWTVATKPFPEAHFATYPPALVETMIKASTKEGDTVLDPFTGAGTTGLVADRLGRKFRGIELNPEYAEMAERRIKDDAPLLVNITVEGI